MSQGFGPQGDEQQPWGAPAPGQGSQPQQPAAPQWGQGPQDSAPQQPSPAPQWGSPDQAPQQSAPEWGSPSPAPQSPWGSPAPEQSSPQWGPASPAGAVPPAGGPAGYPGAGPSGSSVRPVAKWMLIATIAVVAVRLIQLVVGIIAGFAVGFAGASGMGTDGLGATAIVGGAVSLIFMAVNGALSLAVLVLAIITAVQARGRGRMGAFVVIAALVLSTVASSIVALIFAVVQNAAGYEAMTTVVIIQFVVELVRLLIVCAALLTGAILAHRWASQNA